VARGFSRNINAVLSSDVLESVGHPSFRPLCKARLQAGNFDSSTCSPKGERYRLAQAACWTTPGSRITRFASSTNSLLTDCVRSHCTCRPPGLTAQIKAIVIFPNCLNLGESTLDNIQLRPLPHSSAFLLSQFVSAGYGTIDILRHLVELPLAQLAPWPSARHGENHPRAHCLPTTRLSNAFQTHV